MSEWIKQQLHDPEVLPKRLIGMALGYRAGRWDELFSYLYDGRLKIDNSIVYPKF
ncbi:IS66 family transposase [Anditalea andensis]|uniref:IS66 family transposase n=1 Tax=Anditalea andensis TaxID=1048983 RepID=UPI000A00EB49|nr:transposase [Anditalea andensis]